MKPASAIRDAATIRIYDRARRARDPRFDGRFFIAVITTDTYCRPICAARAAEDETVWYFASAAAAEASGFRPCLRCRPEASPGTPAWLATSSVVSRALRLIGDGALDEASAETLADRLGVTARHLRQLFLEHLGATPFDVASTRRLHFAKQLIDETSLACDDIAFAAGFRSVRRFTAEIQRVYDRTPSELRRTAHAPRDVARDRYQFRLAYRPPYAWRTVLRYLAAHAVAGVEHVGDVYRRTFAVGEHHGTIEVAPIPGEHALALDVRFPRAQALLGIVERVRRMFDLGADPDVIASHLGADPMLRDRLAAHPGIRVPGAWDAGELVLQALLGDACDRVAAKLGVPHADARVFPSAAQLATAPLEQANVAPAIADAVRTTAAALAAGTPVTALALPDPMLAAYIAMRALGEPDAFPHAARASDAWRPWRAYAAMLLWADSEPLSATG